ncbi:carbohydrate ABC transporter permease [Micromonospora sp. CB01531]|uniref:carbohydrate ABC transporter permease n=1 Tax=Micromonospora sp. CB01531 TaxID=1718947 RepID=UPI00093AED2B|nr:sugar ABC transporter permease [Micromonospora sp. CB01531]OKI46041.1 ABC transporter permease [Micromonospora sp. CB01531]
MHEAVPSRRSRGLISWVRRGGLSTLVFFLPVLLSFGLFSWWPILRSLPLSVQRTNFLTTDWVGLDNFTRVLADPLLLTATLNTLWFALLALVFGFPVPVILAVFIAELRRTRGLASALVYLPVIFPPVVAVLLWKAFFDPSPTGVLNTILGWAGLGPLSWLNDGDLAMISIVLQATWASFGTATIIYLATLMGVQTELYDAAETDGAIALRRFWHVTLPQMRGVLLVMMLLQLIGTFQVFTEPYIMTNGGPEDRTVTILMLIYRYAFVSGDYGRATALSLLLAIALSGLSWIYLWATKRWSTS